jgi:hypothetical protein
MSSRGDAGDQENSERNEGEENTDRLRKSSFLGPDTSAANSRRASAADPRRMSALENRVRKASAFGQIPTSGTVSARTSALGHTAVMAQSRAITTPKKETDAERVAKIRSDARRRLSNRKVCDDDTFQDFLMSNLHSPKGSETSATQDADTISEDLSPKASPTSKLACITDLDASSGGEGEAVFTTTIALPTVSTEMAEVGRSNSDDGLGEGLSRRTTPEADISKPETSKPAPIETSFKAVPDSPQDQASPRIALGSHSTSPSSAGTRPTSKDKKSREESVNRFPKMEEWEVRVNLHQLAAAFRYSADTFWNSPRRARKQMAPAPKPTRRNSDQIRSMSIMKSFSAAISADMGERQAEAELKRAVKELGLDANPPSAIPGILQPLAEPKAARASQATAPRAPVESPLLKKLATQIEAETESPDPAVTLQAPPILSSLRRTYMRTNEEV